MVLASVSPEDILALKGDVNTKVSELLAESVLSSQVPVINTSNEREAYTAAKEHLIDMIHDYGGDCTMIDLMDAAETFYHAYLRALEAHSKK